MDSIADISILGNNRGIVVGRDIKDTNLINAGDVVGNNNTIIAGANVVLHQIQQARSAIAEAEAGIRLAEMQLADAVARKIQQLTQAVAKSAISERRNPYKSLLDYQLEDTAYFYGRDAAIHELLGKIHDHRLTILHADSGSGKSSLLQAGLMSRLLAAGHLPLRLRPYQQEPTLFIKKTFLSDVETLPELDRFQKMSLVGYLQAVTAYLGNSTLYLFLDQFEEFFTELPRTNQEKFAQELADCLDNTGLDVRWVISLRKEQFSDLSLLQPRISPFVNEYFLPTFKLEEAREVITQPAYQQRVIYENGLVATILADLCDEDGTLQPPQIQLVCYSLFDEVVTSPMPNLISAARYNQQRGRGFTGARGILSNHLTRTLARMPAPERKLASHILEVLVSSNNRRVRITYRKLQAELVFIQQSAQVDNLDVVLAQLVNDRLLRLDEDEYDEPLYELAHDYLLGEIELDEATLKRKFAQELLNQQVEAWRADNTIRIAQETMEIIEKQENVLRIDQDDETLLRLSREAIGRRQRIVRYSYGAAGAALLVAAIAGILAVIFSLSARDARQSMIVATETTKAIQLATDVQVLLRRDVPLHDQILRTAIQAVELLVQNKISVPSAVEQSLRNAIVDTRLVKTYPSPSNTAYQALSLSPGGTVLVTSNEDKMVHLYSVGKDGIQSPRILRGHTEAIQDLSSVRNNWVASIGEQAIVWDIYQGGVVFQIASQGFAIEIDPAGKRLAIGGTGSIQLYDITNSPVLPQRRLTMNSSAVIRDIQFDASGQYLLSGGDEGVVRVWRLEDASVSWESAPLPREVSSVALSADNTMLVATVYDQLWVWRQIQDQTSEQLHFGNPTKVSGHQGYIRQVKFSPNGLCIVTSGDDAVIRLWNATNLTAIATLDGHRDRVDATAFEPYTEPALDRRFSECGKHLYSVGRDKTIRLWNVSAPAEVATFTDFVQPVEALDITTDGSILATADQDGTVSLWDLEKFTRRQAWRHSAERLGDVKFTPDGQSLVTAGYDNRIVFWKWNVNAPQQHFKELLAHRAPVLGLSFSADGMQWVSSGSDLKVNIWNTTTNKIIDSQAIFSRALDAVLSPTQHNLLAVATFFDSRLFDLESDKYWILDQHVTRDVEFLENRELLITAGEAGIYLWDVSDSDRKDLPTPIKLSIDGESPVLALAVAEADNLLVAGTAAGKIIAWTISDVTNGLNLDGRLIAQLGFGINDVAIDPKSGHLVVASEDGTVRVLTLQQEALLQIAKALLQNYQ